MCDCDMFPGPHPIGQTVTAPGGYLIICETALRRLGPRISPHMFPAVHYTDPRPPAIDAANITA